jgi:hypothetical protein
MTDPVLALIVIIAFFLALSAASWFKTLDASLWREARVPLTLGLISGIALRSFGGPVAIGVLLTLAALYTRLTGRESEPSHGMTLGAMTGGMAALPLIIDDRPGTLLQLAACILAGAVAGYGITFGLTHVRQKLRQLLVDIGTAAVAVGAAALPRFVASFGVAERQVAMAAAALVPLLIVIAVFIQWPAVRAQLSHEAALGVILDDDVRPTAHPLLRLGRAGWHDAGAHREFVRIANTIALRKRQQRGRPDEVARLYQLEVIKLRMELQNMTRIDRAMRMQAESEQQPAR